MFQVIWSLYSSLYKSRNLCLSAFASNISADQDQTDLRILLALLIIATISMCAPEPEPITVELTSMTYLKKQAELDRDFVGGSVPFCASKLTVENRIRRENKLESRFLRVERFVTYSVFGVYS